MKVFTSIVVGSIPAAALQPRRRGGGGSATWFSNIFGHREDEISVRDVFQVNQNVLTAPNGQAFTMGTFETPSVADLHARLVPEAPAFNPAIEMCWQNAQGAAAQAIRFYNEAREEVFAIYKEELPAYPANAEAGTFNEHMFRAIHRSLRNPSHAEKIYRGESPFYLLSYDKSIQDLVRPILGWQPKFSDARYVCIREQFMYMAPEDAGALVAAGAEQTDLKGIRFLQVKGDARKMHSDPQNEGAVFQAASQLNCLEMVNPSVTPERGVTMYEKDRTQGPACALACPAGTVFRNWLHAVNGEIGQTEGNQINTIRAMLKHLGIEDLFLFFNGYLFPAGPHALAAADAALADAEAAISAMGLLEVGVQRDTQTEAGHLVTQVYCSAMPVAYSLYDDFPNDLEDNPSGYAVPSRDHWEKLARTVLNGAYQATLAVGAEKAMREGQRQKVYLTLVGGDSFGNDEVWIHDAIAHALEIYREYDLDVILVSFKDIPQQQPAPGNPREMYTHFEREYTGVPHA